MNRSRILLKVFIILFMSHCFVSCNTEDRKIKKALKECVLMEGSDYKLTEYRIVETILKSNLKDSISSSEVSIEVEKEMMRMDSLMLNKYVAEKEKCLLQQQNTSWHLKSSYSSLIRDWQKMSDEKEVELEEKQENIDDIKENIKGWESLINNSETPIIYYVIKHQYILDEKRTERIVLLTTEYEVL